MEAFLLSGPPRAKAGGGVRTRRGAELQTLERLQLSTQGAKAPQRFRREAPRTSLLRQFVCVPVALKVFDGAIVFKPHIVKVSLAGHGVGRADGVRSCGLDGYLAVGR